MKNQKFGVEVELIGITRENAAMVVAGVVGGGAVHTGGGYDKWTVIGPDGRKWTCMHDSSLNSVPSHLRCEFVTPICTWDDIETIQRCVRALRLAGARADKKCGVHVHVDAAAHTAKSLRALANAVCAKEDLLIQALGVHENRLEYCEPSDPDFIARLNKVKPKTLDALAEAWYGTPYWQGHAHDHYDQSRYHVLNLHAVWQKGTVEFRVFNGTTHAGEIKAYIQLCLAINDRALKSASASPRKTETDNPAYTFRCWLLALKLNGPEFATARHHLMKRLPGNAAWRHGDDTTRRGSDD